MTIFLNRQEWCKIAAAIDMDITSNDGRLQNP